MHTVLIVDKNFEFEKDPLQKFMNKIDLTGDRLFIRFLLYYIYYSIIYNPYYNKLRKRLYYKKSGE